MAKTKQSSTQSLRSRQANPLLAAKWDTPFAMPPFEVVKAEHFPPAFEAAMAKHREEIDKIARSETKPTFANTIVAMEKAGRSLNRVAAVFFNLTSANTNEALQAIQRDIAPKLAAHSSAIQLNSKLFQRVDDLYQRRDRLRLDDEARRMLELQHLWLVRAGAKLKGKDKKRIAEINERCAALSTSFMQNVLKDEQSWRLVLEGERDLAGLPGEVVAAAAQAAAEAGLAGKHVITLARSSVEPFLTFSARRDLREEAFKAWAARGENGGESDNREIMAEMIALRTEMAQILGYGTFADYSLVETMAKTRDNVSDLLEQVWEKAKDRAGVERGRLQQVANAEGGNFELAAWDWRHFAEKVRKSEYDLDEAELRPYLQLDNVIAAAFACAGRLFGLTFKELKKAPRYHADVRVWEVRGKGGRHVGVFMGDYFARAGKQSGAWMSCFRGQHKLGPRGAEEVRPIIVNVMSFARGAGGEPTLISFDDARTLFHEMGHALHGLLSDVTYPSLAGTSVVRDFVELPSQLFEHWLMQPEVLKEFAVHARTGKPMPGKLLQRLKEARNFNQGFATVEFTASALVDMELHSQEANAGLDISRFEQQALQRLGMPKEIIMRHRLPHFMHIMGGYAAGYYSYLWSEVMDADAFEAFTEAGDIFDAEVAQRLKEHIYSAGNKRDPEEAYKAFRGRGPSIEGLLKKRGFA